MPNYLTQNDVTNYGPELVDFAQRAAAHTVAPQLEALNQQNAELQRQVAIERRKRLDDEVARAVPNYLEIDNDPRWHAWLRGVDPLNGQIRQQLLNAAIADGSAPRAIAFFRSFLQQHAVAGGQAPGRSGTAATLSDPNKFLTREQVKGLYELHRRDKLTGAEWEQTEQMIITAGAQGRILGGQDPHGK